MDTRYIAAYLAVEIIGNRANCHDRLWLNRPGPSIQNWKILSIAVMWHLIWIWFEYPEGNNLKRPTVICRGWPLYDGDNSIYAKGYQSALSLQHTPVKALKR